MNKRNSPSVPLISWHWSEKGVWRHLCSRGSFALIEFNWRFTSAASSLPGWTSWLPACLNLFPVCCLNVLCRCLIFLWYYKGNFSLLLIVKLQLQAEERGVVSIKGVCANRYLAMKEDGRLLASVSNAFCIYIFFFNFYCCKFTSIGIY